MGDTVNPRPARVVSELRRGYFYPLDVRRALDRHAGPPYVLACARRARRDLDSARNAQRKRALRAIELEAIRNLRVGA